MFFDHIGLSFLGLIRKIKLKNATHLMVWISEALKGRSILAMGEAHRIIGIINISLVRAQ
jgi:hypothetical protein